MARQQTPDRFPAVTITATENGFLVEVGNDIHRNAAARIFVFETFASMAQWMKANVENAK